MMNDFAIKRKGHVGNEMVGHVVIGLSGYDAVYIDSGS